MEAVELVLGAIVFAPGVSLGTVFGVHKPATSENNRFLIIGKSIIDVIFYTSTRGSWTATPALIKV